MLRSCLSSVQSLSLTLCDPMDCNMPGLPVHCQLLEFTQTHVYWVGDAMMPSSHLILYHPFFLLPSIFPSIRVFSNESVLCIRWPKYWSFLEGASVLPVNIQDWSPLGWTGWISLQSKGLSRVFSNTTVQKHQSLSTLVDFLVVHISYSYMTTGKSTALTIQIIVGKVVSLLFNMLSRLVIAFLQRSKHL